MAESTRKREVWVDDIKVVACILVLLGHLMQSMVSSEIISSNAVYLWFNKTIYYFHVPLFFICSGYLYQRYSKVNSVKSWGTNVLNKLISLGIPYFTFTILTWLIKTVFSGAGNNEIDNIFVTLFLEPTSPFWYLYALFFVFLITPTFVGKKSAFIGLGIAIVLKCLSIFGVIQAIFNGGGMLNLT